MFYECNNLSFIDINKFNLSLVNNMSYMFFNCHSLSLDISKFKTKKINNVQNMFYGCNFQKFINNEIKSEK
jgi:surface protein